MAKETIGTFLKDHPRMMGVVFTTLLLLSQTGSAAAMCVVNHGP